MLFSVEQAFVGRDEKRAPLKTPAWEASYGEVLRKKKQNKVFNFQWILAGSLFSATPLPQDETKNPFRVTWKRLEKVIPTWNAYMCKKQQDLQLSTNFAIVVSTRGPSFLDF